MPEFDHIDRQSHQIKDLLQWHRRKILTEQKMAMLPYHTPIRAKKKKNDTQFIEKQKKINSNLDWMKSGNLPPLK